LDEVFAGFICGYMLALVSAPLVAVFIVRLRPRVPLLSRAVPEQVPMVALTVVLFWFTFLLWTALGIVLGLILMGFEDRMPEGGLGSPSLAFTILIIFVSAMAFTPPAVLLRPARRHVIVAALIFLVVFGWLMPYLAEWSPIASS
jgi:FtsH-binding integral membrane protein